MPRLIKPAHNRLKLAGSGIVEAVGVSTPPAIVHTVEPRLSSRARAMLPCGNPLGIMIGDQLLAELRRKSWVDISSADIIVRDRVVHLWFSDKQPREERLTFRVAAENIPGVRRVEEHIVTVPAITWAEHRPRTDDGSGDLTRRLP